MVVVLIGVILIRTLAKPDSWSSKESYRTDAFVELAEQPMKYGGNESCIDCHKEQHEEMMESELKIGHKSLSCESCHGSLAGHVKGESKISDMLIDDSREACLSCHALLVSRPADFPQMDPESRKFSRIKGRLHRKVKSTTQCSKCHDYHDPEL